MVARLQLLDRTEYDQDLDKLLQLVARAQLSTPPSSITARYQEGSRTGETDAYALIVDNISTVASTDQYDMCNFDLSTLHGDHAVNVKEVTLDRVKVRERLANNLFSGSILALDEAISDLTPVLVGLRSHFVHLRERSFEFTEAGYFQPIFTLFLERVATRIGRATDHKPGAAYPLSMDVEVVQEDGSVKTVTVAGKSDIAKITSVDLEGYDVIEFLVELKVPFGALFGAVSDAAQDQLVAQLLGLWECSSGRIVSVGVLTDLFALRLGISCVDAKRDFVVTTAVVEVEDYLLHLLLLFCADCDNRDLVRTDDTAAIACADASLQNSTGWRTGDRDERQRPNAASAEDTTAVSVEDKNASMGQATATVSGTGNPPAPSPRERFPTTSTTEWSCDAEQDLQRWYAHRYGTLVLSKENLQNRRW